MSLHFILGAVGTGKTTQCFKEITEYMAYPGRSAFLLVPDQETYTAERNLADFFDNKGFIDVTVCGFSRLAHHVFRENHSPVREALSPIGQQLVASRIINEHMPELQMLTKIASTPHFPDKLVALFHEFDRFLISPEILKSAAIEEGDSPLGRKLSDLSLLFSHYQAYLSSHFSYSGSIFDLLAEEIPKSKKIRESAVWIDGFNSMTPQKLQIVSALLQTAKQVTCTIQIDRADTSEEIFDRPYRLYTAIASLERHFSSITLKDAHRFSSPRIHALVSDFFKNIPAPCALPPESPVKIKEGIHLVSAPDIYYETDFIARRILTLVRDEHLCWKDIFILLRNPEEYRDALERRLTEYQIPYFSDGKNPMNNHPLLLLLDGIIRFLRAEAKGKNHGFTRSHIFRLLKTNLLSVLSPDDMNHLENYVLKYHIRYGQWQKEWAYRDYWSLDSDNEPPPNERLLAEQKQSNLWRMKILSLLNPLVTQWNEAKTVKEKCTFLYQWLVDQHIPDKLSAWDDLSFAKEKIRPHVQAWKKTLFLWEEIVHIAGDEMMDDESFFSLLQDGLSALSYSMIPPTLDHVTISSTDRGYAAEAKIIFIPGAGEGDFPKRVENSGFFTEEEKQSLLTHSSLNMGNTLLEQIEQEQFYTYLSLSRSRDSLYISYPESKSDGSENEPSFLFTQLEALQYHSSHITVSPPSLTCDDASFFALPEQALSLLPNILQSGIPAENSRWTALKDWAHVYAPRLLHDKLRSLFHINRSTNLPPSLAKKLFTRNNKFYGSVTQLQNYRACPYRYFLQYGLHVAERETGEVDALDFGNYLHAGLKRFDKEMKKTGKKWCDATEEETEKFIQEVTEKLTPKVKGGSLTFDETSKHTRDSLTKALRNSLDQLKKWNAQSHFSIGGTEYDFRIQLYADQNDSFTLRGKIDRLDISPDGTHVAVYDYKTGRPKADLSDIVNGVSLQLMTYLLALCDRNEEKNFLPAAMMYIYLHQRISEVTVPTDENISLKESENTNGFVLSDPDILKQLDEKSGTPDGFISVKYKKDGTISSASATLTAEQFEYLKEITKTILIRLYKDLSKGIIPVYPIKDTGKTACTYCPYQPICHFEPNLQGNKYNYLPKYKKLKDNLPHIWESMKEEKENL